MRKIRLELILILIKNIISWTPYYIPFNNKKEGQINQINSVYGTGNRLFDSTYRAYCAILCKQSTYSDEYCCIGETLQYMKCELKSSCEIMQNDFKNYVLKVAFLSYFSFVLFTMIIVFIIYYCNSKPFKYKIRNGTAASIIVFSGSLIIPIIIIQIYCCYKNIEIYQFFGGDFTKCCSGRNILSLQSVEIKESNQKDNELTTKSERNKSYRNINEKNNITNKDQKL